MRGADLVALNAARRERRAGAAAHRSRRWHEHAGARGRRNTGGPERGGGDSLSDWQIRIGGGGWQETVLNVHVPPPRIAVIGAVHISQALAQMAGIAGFDLRIIDPRTAFATEERFEGVELVADWPETF